MLGVGAGIYVSLILGRSLSHVVAPIWIHVVLGAVMGAFFSVGLVCAHLEVHTDPLLARASVLRRKLDAAGREQLHRAGETFRASLGLVAVLPHSRAFFVSGSGTCSADGSTQGDRRTARHV